MLLQVAEAVSFLQNLPRPILHGDIGQSNILLAYDGLLKLSDFGSARFCDTPDSKHADVASTPVYMAPEQVTEAAVLATDVWQEGKPLLGKSCLLHLAHGCLQVLLCLRSCIGKELGKNIRRIWTSFVL
jgi:serine/threonine protein kinase